MDELHQALTKITLPWQKAGNRAGFPKYRSAVFGDIRSRRTGKRGPSAASLKHPEIHRLLFELGATIAPNCTACNVNQNLVSPPHRDTNNSGESVIVSFGNYEGGLLVVNGVEHDTKTPLKFNGCLLEHYNTPITQGNKYSVIFYNNPR